MKTLINKTSTMLSINGPKMLSVDCEGESTDDDTDRVNVFEICTVKIIFSFLRFCCVP
jgi:hypothetical protein